jgi:hypothetical protein
MLKDVLTLCLNKAECRYAERRYAECRGALGTVVDGSCLTEIQFFFNFDSNFLLWPTLQNFLRP